MTAIRCRAALVVVRAASVLAVLALLLVAIPACNTVEGVGEDVSAAGQGLSGASREVAGKDDDG